MDTLAAIALATEPPNMTDLVGEPVKTSDTMFSPEMWRSILGVATYQFLIMAFILFLGPLIFGGSYGFITQDYYDLDTAEPTTKTQIYTIMFNAFIFMQLFNELNCRKLNTEERNVFENFFNNFTFLMILVLQFALQYLMVTFGGKLFRTASLSMGQQIFCVVVGALTLAVGLGLKHTPHEWLEKIPVKVNEEDGVQDDAVMNIFKSVTVKDKDASPSKRVTAIN